MSSEEVWCCHLLRGKDSAMQYNVPEMHNQDAIIVDATCFQKVHHCSLFFDTSLKCRRRDRRGSKQMAQAQVRKLCPHNTKITTSRLQVTTVSKLLVARRKQGALMSLLQAPAQGQHLNEKGVRVHRR